MQLVFDIEANNLLDKVDTLWCIATIDEHGNERSFGPSQVKDGLDYLQQADMLIGHNIVGYDLPALYKMFPDFKFGGKVLDTLICTRLMFPTVKDKDFIERRENMPTKLYGSHSLKAWGHRLGDYKDEYEAGFDEYCDEMLEYCEQDVRVTAALYKLIKQQNYDERAIELEHEINRVCFKMEQTGFHFNASDAGVLYGQLASKRDEIKRHMEETFEGTVKHFKTKPPVTIPFNPSSRQQIAARLISKYGWKPKTWTPAGQPKIDEETLGSLSYPEAQQLAEYFMLEKRIGMIAEGNNGYLKLVDTSSKLKGRYITNGAITGRATHMSPNLAQVPSLRVPYGKEIRELFTVPDGWSMVGCDLSGIELRCLAHYLAAWDDGAYASVILDGDIHTANQEAAGLPTRDDAKKFIYTLVYGGGDQKLGEVIGKGRNEGKAMKDKFFKAIPAFRSLRSAVEGTLDSRGHLLGLDGRKLHPRSQHSALNTLLQSAGALVAKRWVINAFDDISSKYEHGWDADFVFSGWIHDEVQVSCKEEIAEDVGNRLRRSAEKAGEDFKFKCRVDAEYGVGSSWAATH